MSMVPSVKDIEKEIDSVVKTASSIQEQARTPVNNLNIALDKAESRFSTLKALLQELATPKHSELLGISDHVATSLMLLDSEVNARDVVRSLTSVVFVALENAHVPRSYWFHDLTAIEKSVNASHALRIANRLMTTLVSFKRVRLYLKRTEWHTGQHLTGSLLLTVTTLLKVLELSVEHVGANHLRLKLRDDTVEHANGLSIAYVRDTVLPYIEAIWELQQVIDQERGQVSGEFGISRISVGTVTVDVTGGITEALQMILDWIVPYRRRTKRQQAELEIQEKELKIQRQRLDLERAEFELSKLKSESLSTMDNDAQVTEKTQLVQKHEELKLRLMEEQLKTAMLQNTMTEFSLFKEAVEYTRKNNPDWSETQVIDYATRTHAPARIPATSSLELLEVSSIAVSSTSADRSQANFES